MAVASRSIVAPAPGRVNRATETARGGESAPMAYNQQSASFQNATKGGGPMAKGTGMRKEKKKPKKTKK